LARQNVDVIGFVGRSGNDNTTALEMMPSKGNYPKMVELGGLRLQ
jgi:hypothetical protein